MTDLGELGSSITDHNETADTFPTAPLTRAPSSRRPALGDSSGQQERQTSFRLPGLDASNTGRLSVSFRLNNARADDESSEDSYDPGSDDSYQADASGKRKSKSPRDGEDEPQKRKTLDQTLATTETKAVRLLRIMIWIGLSVTMIIFCSIVYWYSNKLENEEFENQFYDLAEQFVNGFHSNVQLQLQVMDLFSLTLTTIAMESQQVWPFVTLGDVEAIGTSIRSIVNNAPKVSIYPLVSHDLRPPWEQYTQQLHNIDWINQSQSYQAYLKNNKTIAPERIRRKQRKLLNQQQQQQQSEVLLRDLLTQYHINYTDYPDLNITTTDLTNFPSSTPTESPAPSTAPTIAPTGRTPDETDAPITPPPTARPTVSPTATFKVGSYETVWDGIYGSNPHIYRIAHSWQDAVENQNGKLVINEPLDAPGPFYPMWQQSPYLRQDDSVDSTLRRINYNTYSSNDLHRQAIEIVQNQSQAVFAPGKSNSEAASKTTVQPGSSLLYPIFDIIVPTSASSKKSVVAILELEILWQDFISNILPETSSDTLLVVVTNCQQSYRYEVTGASAVYFGVGDVVEDDGDKKHETSDFDHLQLDIQLTFRGDDAVASSSYYGVPLNEEYCPWELQIYATKDMQEAYVTNFPLYYTLMSALVFVWTCMIFLLYDWLVERRQKKVMKTAVKSDEIVSQLFPNIFRDALYGNNANDKSNDDKKEKKDSGMDESTPGRASGSGFHTDIIEEFKRSVGNNDEEGNPTQPMARLYPNCTVFFADIAGFTAWSSARSPAQVFTLLETLYGAFDKLAHRRRVFKIETIGDCYVAVTGLPQPQPSHALLMVKFARDCLAKIPGLLKKLATSLGPDTTNLAMRVGLHSGPVTAGVLRGEKARFQLFGDTVNTAARMESNGKKECIHCSQETADILLAAGKGHWVHPRGERIHAKGKGELQTYWVIPSSGESAMFEESMQLDSEEEDFDNDDSDGDNKEAVIIESAIKVIATTEEEKVEMTKLAEKSFKSIGWTVDLLWSQVKDIAWERRKTSEIDEVEDVWNNETKSIADIEPNWNEDLQQSLFDLANSTDQRGDKAWRVPGEQVREQLTMYVLILALQYKSEAAFHNQDHMAFVLVSVDRMLKQLNTILGRDRQVNAWAEFTLILAVIIGDINPASFGLRRVAESEDSAERHKAAFQANLITSWDLLIKDRFLELRKVLCVNNTELRGFQQLLVNLVFAGDISVGPNMRDREYRWNEAFRNADMEESPKNMLHLRVGSILEHISLAAQWTHTMQIWETYKKWNSCMFQELCDNYDKGIIEEDPATDWFQQELILFDNIILPMLERLQEANALGATGSELLKCATSNRRSWGRLFLSPT